nr:MAG TPA: putative tail component [Caudoviricetes sp.]
MAKVDCDFSQFDKFVGQIEEATLPEIVRTVESRAVNKLAAEYLGKAIKHTPDRGVQKIQVEGKEFITDSEHMKRSWGAEPARFVAGHGYLAKVYNSASYASYVNDGHRQRIGRFVPILGKRLVEPWVYGKHMAEKATKHTCRISSAVLEAEILRYLKGVFRG